MVSVVHELDDTISIDALFYRLGTPTLFQLGSPVCLY
jgi:hypothetical protein